ncbi:MAG: glycosyltransferase family 2 protein, partial [Candidatus Gastranaerophilales bacterium]|nr:glycosyltransferase family 2 protein [Candidatus Gastranaerophilales bacterium]
MEQELKTEKEIIVKNAQGDADTRATIVHQNNINYIPKVSVIIPCYNAEKYLKECLDSVVNQTLKEIEIICVDDGSTDSTLEILKEYTQKDNRFTILTQENLHAGVARNAGLAVARGEYLSFLDSDDFFELDMLEKMQFKLDENKAEIAASGFYRYDSETNKDIQISKISEKYIVGLFSPQEFKQDLFQISTPAAWSKMYKRDFLINKEIRFESLKSTNDLTFTDVAFCLANKIVTMNEPFVHYRINSNCNISANRGDKTENFIEAIKKVKTILSQRKKFNTFKDTYYKQFVASAIWELGFCSDLNYYKKIQNKVGSLLPENYKKMFFESTEKRISIIVCVYNDDKYINEALESLLKQTYENIEIICVNDGSTDNSLKILEEYAQKDERIKIINQKNQGLACSRNNALKIASGKYVVFVDSDDYIVENACEVLFEKAEKFNLDMLSYGGVNFDNDTLKQSSNPYYEFRYLPDGFNIDCFSYKDCKSFISKMAVSSCLTMYKRSLIEQKNILFPAGVCFEDNLFFCKALTQALRCGIVKDALYFRRVHSASITQNWAKHHNDYVHVADLVLKYLKSIGVDKKIFESYKDSYITGILDRYNEFETKYQK